ncbi:MAG: 30S ribosomal protein S17e [Candidatus Diapherotrites archaeon CG09_land_8_20_14_0_10_32_12]|nr:MAG: 30S ribosomal protein S17e [Candidatus Diapherotrites archaeon CG09_land_8_20_14_0_10_32_12]
MGKSMLKPLKSKANTIMESMKEIGTDFDTNKKAINKLGLPITKTNVNKMAGYMARQKKRKQKD